MDYDDPEKRIAELERQLAERRAPAGSPPGPGLTRPAVTAGHLTPQDIHNISFSRPPMGKRGYNEDEVDAFLDFIEAALQDPARRAIAAEQVRHVAFAKPPIGKRGYHEGEVDAFLDRVAQELGGPPAAAGPPPAGTSPAGSPAATSYSLRIRPNLFLFWAPRWRDWRSDGSGTSTDTGTDFVDIIAGFFVDLVLPIVWNWGLWVVWAAIAWLLETSVALLLSPISLLASLFGVRRHRLLAESKDGSEELLLCRGSWYAVRRARNEAWDQIEREGALTV